MDEPDFQCYVCGQPLGVLFALVALSKSIDRAFLLHRPCVD